MTRLQREITVDGVTHTLYSFDGIAWSTDAQDVGRRIARSERALENFHSAHQYPTLPKPLAKHRMLETFTQKIETQVNGIMEPGGHAHRLSGPVILPVTHHGSPILGKDKGKNQKYRRTLRRKKEIVIQKRESKKGYAGIGVVPVPTHYHRCHNNVFACQCAQPFFKRKCGGGAVCLVDKANQERKEA